MNRFLALMALSLTALLLTSAGAIAWHDPANEVENVAYMSQAGDPRYTEDGEACMDPVGHSHEGANKPHCIVLYAHNWDLLQPVPINIQRPPECVPDLARGFSGTPGIDEFWPFSRALLYSSAGFVEYAEATCDVTDPPPRHHPERGLTSDIVIDRATDIIGYWYMSVDTLEFSPLGLDGHTNPVEGANFGAMPCVAVYMEIQTGRFAGKGDVLASGTATRTMVTTPGVLGDPPELEVPDPCGDESQGPIVPGQATEFVVNLGKAERNIPFSAGYILNVLWYQFTPNAEESPQGQNNIVMREWNRHNGAEYPNRILLPVEESIRVERVRTQPFDSKLFIHMVLNSPWGSYDVDTENIRVEIFKENGEPVQLQHLGEPVLRYSVDHDGHFKPVNATFPWDYQKEGLDDGRYTVKVSVPNWQHTADATRTATFTLSGDSVEEEGENASPTPPDVEDSPAGAFALTALAVLALAGFALRRRR